MGEGCIAPGLVLTRETFCLHTAVSSIQYCLKSHACYFTTCFLNPYPLLPLRRYINREMVAAVRVHQGCNHLDPNVLHQNNGIGATATGTVTHCTPHNHFLDSPRSDTHTQSLYIGYKVHVCMLKQCSRLLIYQ